MQEMIGIVASVIIGAIIFLLLALVQWRGQHTSIDAAQFAAAKVSILDLVEVMEEDLTNLGAGVSVADMRNATARPNGGFSAGSDAFDTTSTTRTIKFSTWADTTSVPTPLSTTTNEIVYSWTATGEQAYVLDPATGTYGYTDTYLLTRTVDGAAAGESMDTITEITFDLFDADGLPTSTLADVRTIEVTVQAVSPLGGGTEGMVDTEAGVAPAVSETRWHKTFRPPNLARKLG